MQEGPKFLLVLLYWAIRAYLVLIVAWAIMTWIPGLAGSQFHNIVGLPVVPVLNLFSFLSFGGIGFGALIVAFGLNMVANWLAKQIVQPAEDYGPPAIDGADVQPGPPPPGPPPPGSAPPAN